MLQVRILYDAIIFSNLLPWLHADSQTGVKCFNDIVDPMFVDSLLLYLPNGENYKMTSPEEVSGMLYIYTSHSGLFRKISEPLFLKNIYTHRKPNIDTVSYIL